MRILMKNVTSSFAPMGSNWRTTRNCVCTFMDAMVSSLSEPSTIWFNPKTGSCDMDQLIFKLNFGIWFCWGGTWKQLLLSGWQNCQHDIYPLAMLRCFGMNSVFPTLQFRNSFIDSLESNLKHCTFLMALWLLFKTRYETFWRRYSATWANTLRFSPQSDHSTCDICMDCKEQFKTAIDS